MRKVLYSGVIASILLVSCDSTNQADPPKETMEETPSGSSATAAPTERKPTKDVVFSVEGQDETIKMDLMEGRESLYSFYVDKERYQFERLENFDVLTPVEPLPDSYPEVKMEIRYIHNQSPDKVKEEVKKDLSFTVEEETVTSPVQATSLHGTSGIEPDSQVFMAYLMDAGEAGTLLITEAYSLEAQEGHGARFFQMLETLEIQQ